MIKKLFLVLLLLMIPLLVSCSQESSNRSRIPIEDEAMVGVMSFDYLEDNKMKLTVAVPQYSPNVKKNVQISSVTTDLVSNGIVKVGRMSEKKVVLNQLRVILVNEEFARKTNMRKIIEYLYRKAEVGNRAYIAVVKGSAEDIIKGNYPDKQNVIYYLKDLLQPSMTTAFNPNTNIHFFMFTSTSKVYDPILPVIAKKGEHIEIEGVALFKNDKMIDTISPSEAVIIQALQGKKNLAPVKLNLEAIKGKVMLDLIKANIRATPNRNLSSPKLKITLKLKGLLSEYKGEMQNEIDNPRNLAILENAVNKEVEKEILEFLGKVKEKEIDPIGFTDNFRMHYHGKWTQQMTVDLIKKVKVDVHVDSSILSTGTLK
ncbi:Ger(x)C family spore germination protein [Rummeliibacillus sp. JY-2-4R]